MEGEDRITNSGVNHLCLCDLGVLVGQLGI